MFERGEEKRENPRSGELILLRSRAVTWRTRIIRSWWVVFIIFTIGMSGCPDPVTYHAFGTPYVVKIDFTKDGVCHFPFFYYLKSEYTNANSNEYINHGTFGSNIEPADSWPPPTHSYWIGPDTYIANKKTCSIIYSHSVEESDISWILTQTQIDNYNKDFIPLTMHLKNTLTNEEFHTQGEFPVFDISTIPVCRKVLDGWKSGEKSFVDECVLEIPSTVTPDWTPGSGFDWCQLPEYSSIPGACE